MTRTSGSLILHTLSCGIMFWAFKQLDTVPMDERIKVGRGGHWQFLTIQCLAIAGLTMVLGALADLFPSVSGIRKHQRKLLMVSLPLAVIVSMIYWSLILFAPSLILPPAPDFDSVLSSSSAASPLARVPLPLDIALHASPLITLLLEFILYQEPYSSYDVSYTAPVLIIVAGIWYGSFVEYCASYNKSFPYPFLTNNILGVRIIIYSCATLLALLTSRAVNALHP
ncbi:FAR-17a/AIG1-like protein [Hysterangium stoloniferum]|nr:FAR-17a/AIG1-like protein [Hysterangium stoloniferum]